MDRELIETLIQLLSVAINAEGDTFGEWHNTAIDTQSELENLLQELE